MLKQFLKDSAVYGLAAMLTRSLSFVLVPVYTRALTPSDYGMVDIVAVFASLMNVTIALEISQAVARYYGDAPTREEKVSYASTALWFTVAAYSGFWAVGALAESRIGAMLFGSAVHEDVIRIALPAIWASGLFYLVQNQLRWELSPRRYAVASLVQSGVTLTSAIALVVGLHLEVRGVLGAQLAGSVAGTGVGIYFARATFRPVFSWPRCLEMLRFSAPLVPSSIGAFVALYIDRIAIRHLMTLGDVGVFGVGYRVASVIGLVMVAFQSALTPLVYTHHRDSSTPAQLARIFRYFVVLALLVCLGLSLFGKEILATFTTPVYVPAAQVVSLLAPAVLLSNMYIFAPGLSIARRTGLVALLTIAGALLNTVLNFTLIPVLGIRGAALATLVSAFCLFAGYMVASQRLYRVPHAWRAIGAAAVASAGLGWVAGMLTLPPATAIVVKAVLLVGAAIFFAHLGLVRKDEIRRGIGLMRLKARELVA